jgi:hypothetical protein
MRGLFRGFLLLLAFHGTLHAADRVKIGVANYNLSNLSVGVAQTKGFFKEEGIEAEIIALRPQHCHGGDGKRKSRLHHTYCFARGRCG